MKDTIYTPRTFGYQVLNPSNGTARGPLRLDSDPPSVLVERGVDPKLISLNQNLQSLHWLAQQYGRADETGRDDLEQDRADARRLIEGIGDAEYGPNSLLAMLSMSAARPSLRTRPFYGSRKQDPILDLPMSIYQDASFNPSAVGRAYDTLKLVMSTDEGLDAVVNGLRSPNGTR